MTYAEYRAQRLATADEPRPPPTWRINGHFRAPNDRAHRRRQARLEEQRTAQPFSPKTCLWIELRYRLVDSHRLTLQHRRAIDRLLGVAV